MKFKKGYPFWIITILLFLSLFFLLDKNILGAALATIGIIGVLYILYILLARFFN